MTREEAIAWFEERTKGMVMSETRSMYQMALSALRAQPAKDTNVPTNRWFSVKDRLPRCGESVIVTDGELVHEARLSVCHKWWRRAGVSWLRIDATHWQPMPSTEGIEDDT